MIERFLRLKTSEAVAIRWHMGGFDDELVPVTLLSVWHMINIRLQ